jgi:hypothetical protein
MNEKLELELEWEETEKDSDDNVIKLKKSERDKLLEKLRKRIPSTNLF